jgi:tetratricopeptide (TPR) repeat protein
LSGYPERIRTAGEHYDDDVQSEPEAGWPRPDSTSTLDEFVDALVDLRHAAGQPSFAEIVRRVGQLRADRGLTHAKPGRVTVFDCFKHGRRRLDIDLVCDVVEALGDATGAVHWRRTYAALTAPTRADGHGSETALAIDVLDYVPPAVDPFVGRNPFIDEFEGMPAGCLVLSGLPGVGKTELARRLAGAWAESGGATLYADLRGGGDQGAVTPDTVMTAMLRKLGHPGAHVEQLSFAELVDEFHSAITSRKCVVVLDNAQDEDQVRSLIAPPGTCRMLVTSRRALPGLTAVHRRLEPFSVAESLELLATGWRRIPVDADEPAATEVVELCGRLPLELSLAAAAMDQRPHWSMADHATRLRSNPRDEVLRPSLSNLYAQLPPTEQWSFRALAVYPGSFTTVDVVASLLDTTLTSAGELLDQLCISGLVERRRGQFRLHDVVRAFADRTAALEDPHSAQRVMFARLVRHVAAGVRAAAQQRGAAEPISAVPADESGATTPWNIDDADGWFEEHRPNLLAVAHQAARWGLPTELSALTIEMAPLLDTCSHFRDSETMHRLAIEHGDPRWIGRSYRHLARTYAQTDCYDLALECLRLAGDGTDEEAQAVLRGIGHVLVRLGRLDEAVVQYRLSAEAAQRCRDERGRARSDGSRADVYRHVGRVADAAVLYADAAERSRAAGDLANHVFISLNWASMCTDNGDPRGGLERFADALALAESCGLQASKTRALVTVAKAHRLVGELPEATAALDEAEPDIRESGQRTLLCELLLGRADLLTALGDVPAAIELQIEARHLAHVAGAPLFEAIALNGLAGSYAMLGRLDEAVETYGEALRWAEKSGDPAEVARAHEGLAGSDMQRRATSRR